MATVCCSYCPANSSLETLREAQMNINDKEETLNRSPVQPEQMEQHPPISRLQRFQNINLNLECARKIEQCQMQNTIKLSHQHFSWNSMDMLVFLQRKSSNVFKHHDWPDNGKQEDIKRMDKQTIHRGHMSLEASSICL